MTCSLGWKYDHCTIEATKKKRKQSVNGARAYLPRKMLSDAGAITEHTFLQQMDSRYAQHAFFNILAGQCISHGDSVCILGQCRHFYHHHGRRQASQSPPHLPIKAGEDHQDCHKADCNSPFRQATGVMERIDEFN